MDDYRDLIKLTTFFSALKKSGFKQKLDEIPSSVVVKGERVPVEKAHCLELLRKFPEFQGKDDNAIVKYLSDPNNRKKVLRENLKPQESSEIEKVLEEKPTTETGELVAGQEQGRTDEQIGGEPASTMTESHSGMPNIPHSGGAGHTPSRRYVVMQQGAATAKAASEPATSKIDRQTPTSEKPKTPAITTTPRSTPSMPSSKPLPTTPKISTSPRPDFSSFQPPPAAMNAAKNLGSSAGISFKKGSGAVGRGLGNMAKGLGRGIVGPGLTSTYNLLGKAGMGGINAFSRLSGQIGGGGLGRGAFGKNTGRKAALAFLGFFLIFGIAAGIMGGQTTPTETTPGGNVGIGSTSPTTPGVPITPSAGLNGPSNFVYFCQGNTSMQECSLGAAGCGPSSVAMVMSTFGVSQTPVDVDRIFRANGWRTCNDGPSYLETAINSGWFREAGFQTGPNIGSGSLNTAQVKKYLDEGWLIIGSSDQYPCVNCRSLRFISHIFVIDAIDIATNRIDVRDPNNCSYTDGNDEIQSNRIRNINFVSSWRYAYPVKLICDPKTSICS